jgi:hypothetical protein
MPLPHLLTRTAWLIRRTDSGDTDDYGNDIPDEIQFEERCEVQQDRRTEQPEGAPAKTDWLGFFPADTDLDASDAVVVDGLAEFEVVGEPWTVRNPRTRVPSHVEATLRRVGGSEGGS